MKFDFIEKQCRQHMARVCAENPDPSHDLLHVERVVATAKHLAAQERADITTVVAAAWLHDCLYISKSDERRHQASRLSAELAARLLREWDFPASLIPAVCHAIEAHSFSAGIPAQSLEAKIVQDADRLDAMGAIGAFRCFAFSGGAKRPLYAAEDPFCGTRTPDDQQNTLDHFFVKLLKLSERLHTKAARSEGARRLRTMESMIQALAQELNETWIAPAGETRAEHIL